jgi:hypothetical protein
MLARAFVKFPVDSARGQIYETGRSKSGNLLQRAVSSVVEHLTDTEGVTGSNPVSRISHLWASPDSHLCPPMIYVA